MWLTFNACFVYLDQKLHSESIGVRINLNSTEHTNNTYMNYVKVPLIEQVWERDPSYSRIWYDASKSSQFKNVSKFNNEQAGDLEDRSKGNLSKSS